jgi:DNA-binding transcriptional regulator PaaX
MTSRTVRNTWLGCGEEESPLFLSTFHQGFGGVSLQIIFFCGKILFKLRLFVHPHKIARVVAIIRFYRIEESKWLAGICWFTVDNSNQRRLLFDQV